MKKILTVAFLLIVIVSYSQQYTNNPAWGVGVKRFVITEGDTVGTKLGVTIISGVLYVANGTKWTPVGTGGSSLPPQTGNNGKYLKTNGTSASWQLANLLDSIDYTNAGTATVLRVKPGGSGLYKYEFALGGGINTLSVSDPLKTTGTSTPTLSIDTVTRPEGLFTLGKWAKDSAAIIASIASKSGKVYAGNGLTNVNDSTLRTDTSLTATKDYVNYKDDIQQGFIDLRKLESDSTASSGYIRRDRALNIAQETTRDSLNVVRSSLALKVNYTDTTDRTLGVRSNARAIGDSAVLAAKIKYSIDSLNALLINQNKWVKNEIDYNFGTLVNIYGDSYIEGYNASSYSKNAVSQIGVALGTNPLNLGRSGRGYWAVNRLARLNQNTTSNSKALIVAAGLNDLRRGNGGVKTYNKIMNGLKSFLANAFLEVALPASSASITKIGTWADWTYSVQDSAAGKATSLSGTAKMTSTTNDSLTYSFSGYDNIVISVVAGDGVTYSPKDFRIIIDGYNYGTYSFSGYTDGISDDTTSNAYLSVPIYIKNLTQNTTHNVSIRAMGTGGSTFVLDYIGHLQNPVKSKPVVISGMSKLPQAGYAILFTNYGNIINDTTVDISTTYLLNAIKEYSGYPIAFSNPNAYLNKTTSFSSDNIHPNDIGMTDYANSMLAAFKVNNFYQFPIDLTDASTITWDVSASKNANVTLTSTGRTLSVTNAKAGDYFSLKVIQGTGGGKTITTYPTPIKWFNGIAPALSPTAANIDFISFYFDGTTYFGTYMLNFQ